MKLFVQFRTEAEDTRFVVLCGSDDTVAALRRSVAMHFREVFPARAPLVFFRMASASDGFFLPDAGRVGEVLTDGSTVLCERADKEAPSAPLRDIPNAEEVEDILGVFRAQLAYVARAACHAALRGVGAKSTAEGMSVLLALLVVGGGGSQFADLRAEALAALQRGLREQNGAMVPGFIAAGGLFVLLGLLSPSTRMDADNAILEAAARLLEQLCSDHGEALAPLLQDCAPASLLQKLAADSRCNAAIRKNIRVAHKLLEPRGITRSDSGGRRPHSMDRSERLRRAGSSITGGASSGRITPEERGVPLPSRTGLALHLRSLVESPGDSLSQTRALAQIEASTEAQSRAANVGLPLADALLLALREATTAQGRVVAPWLPTLGRIVAHVAGDPNSRHAFCGHLAAVMLGLSGHAAPTPREVADAVKSVWPRLPSELRLVLPLLVGEALAGGGAASAGTAGCKIAAAVPQGLLALIISLLDSSVPEEFQVQALRALCPSSSGWDVLGAVASDGSGTLTPKTANAILLRLIPRQPLLCLDVLGALALKEHFRFFFCTQTSLLHFISLCCEQPGAVLSSAVKVVDGDQALALQRSAARCLANLSAHPAARDWARRSAVLRAVLLKIDDLVARTYLGVALGVDDVGFITGTG
mmetsp:Transcript_83004/g.231661  ORF Transcript_83004/g.231661 Transcript_83004/m.231661 type:complete len:647 (+) Transcript_83004:88-2028(+)